MKHILNELSQRYPQLLFPIAPGTSQTEEYRDVVYRGKVYHGELDFTMSDRDWFVTLETPAGTAEALLLHNRRDFEKCACALTNKCEPREIPPSVGAFMISGLINWKKVRQICSDRGGVTPANLAFIKFSGQSIHDRLILLSSGWYSGVAPEAMGLSDEDWTEKSVTIRMYHELTHFICRSLYPKNIDIIRDEVFADLIGLVAAFGYYDPSVAKLFLGITDTGFTATGRIHHYIKDQAPDQVFQEVNAWISLLDEKVKEPTEDITKLTVRLFEEIIQVN